MAEVFFADQPAALGLLKSGIGEELVDFVEGDFALVGASEVGPQFLDVDID
jgi:hypothetical protein